MEAGELSDPRRGFGRPPANPRHGIRHLNGFHMYADDRGHQVEAGHVRIRLRPGLHRCVIFDRNAPDARLIGVGYIEFRRP